MNNKLILSLLLACSLFKKNNLPAFGPHAIITISEAVNHGASITWLAQAAATGVALGHVARFGIAEIGIFSGLALSLGIKKDTTLIRTALTHLATKTESIHAAIIENALRNSAEHKFTQDGIAGLRSYTGSEFLKLNQKIDEHALEVSKELAELKALIESERGTAAERDRFYRLQFEKILKDLETLKTGQKTGLSRLSGLFKKK